MVRLAFVALALLAFAGPVDAALSIAEVRAPPDPLEPGGELGTIEVDVVVDCSSVFARTTPPATPEGVEVTFEASEHLVITGATNHPLPSDACQTPAGTATLTAPFQVVVLREAAGLRPLPAVVRAILPGTPVIPDAAEDTAEFTVTPAPFLAYQAEVGTKLKTCGCPVAFDVAVTNYGNVRTTVSFELATAPSFGNVTLPAPFELDPSSPGSTSTGTGTIIFQAPADAWGEVAIGVSVRGTATEDAGSIGAPVTVNMLVRNSAAQDRDLPALDPGFVVLALAALGSAAARRRA